jgi:hypothetical protein
MSTEQQPLNDYENTPGKPEGKIDDSSLPTTNDPVTETPSASDKAQSDIKSLRGDYGQNEPTINTHEREDMGERNFC